MNSKIDNKKNIQASQQVTDDAFNTIPDAKGIKDFKPEMIKPYSVICCIAKRGSGKTVLINDLVSSLYDRYDEIYAFSRSASYNDPYPFPAVKEDNRIEGLNMTLLNSIYQKQKNDIKEFKSKDNPNVKFVCIILDDIIADDNVSKRGSNNLLTELACNSRHFKMDIFLSSQVLQSGYNPQIRKNIDYFFAFRINDGSTMEGFCKLYLSRFKKNGPLLVDNITNYDDFYTIVADNKDASKMKNITDYIYKYRADPKKQFSFEKKIDKNKYNYEGLDSLFDNLEVEEFEYMSDG